MSITSSFHYPSLIPLDTLSFIVLFFNLSLLFRLTLPRIHIPIP